MIKIFHTADIHLDSPFGRMAHSERMAARRHQREIFEKMMRYVKENSFDVLLISGDLFDTTDPSAETEECVIKAFSSLECPVVISPGNHDPYLRTPVYFKQRLPENVYVFSSDEIQVFEFEELGLQVCGYAFTASNTYEKNPLEGFEKPAFDGVSVLCAHAELDTPLSRSAPLSRKDIAERGFAYAALGHIHNFDRIIHEGESVIAYSGCPEGRAFDEQELGGAMSVTIADGRVSSVERIIFSERRYLCRALDISGVSDDTSLLERVKEYIRAEGFDENTALRLTLTGEVDMSFTPDKSFVQNGIAKMLMLAEIEDATFPHIDVSELERDPTLRGAVYKKLKAELDSPDPKVRKIAAQALKTALFAIDRRDIR